MGDFFVLFLLLSFVQFIYIFTLQKPKKISSHHLVKSLGIGKLQFLLIAFILLLYILLVLKLVDYHKPHPIANTAYHYTSVMPTVSADDVQLLGTRKTSFILNYYFLYLRSDKSEETLSNIAWRLREQYCKQLCIINLYDDTQAYTLDIQRVNITSVDVMKDWNKKNYMYVADHYLGYLDAIQEAKFSYYPFHDGYYRRLKAGEE